MSNFNLTLHTCGPGEPDHGMVKAIQTLLNTRINAGLTVDGVYGTSTVGAVKIFQTVTGYPNGDGACGPVTWDNLITLDVIL